MQKEPGSLLRTPIAASISDELLSPITSWKGCPIDSLLTTEEVASGCRVYQVPNDFHVPALQAGDYVVAQPLAPELWAAIAPGSFCLLRVRYVAIYDSEEEFHGHHISCITSNGLRYGGVLASLQDDEASERIPIESEPSDLVEICRLIRSIRPL